MFVLFLFDFLGRGGGGGVQDNMEIPIDKFQVCTLENMLICMIYKYTKGGMYVSDTRCLNAYLLTQFYVMFYVTHKIMVICKMG